MKLMRAIMSRRKLLTKLLVLGVVLAGCMLYVVFESLQEVKVKVNNGRSYTMYDVPVVEKVAKGRSKVNGTLHYKSPLDVARVAEYCNIPSHIQIGEEGEAPKDYVLLSAHVVIRHGDRTPMTSYLNIPRPAPSSGCTMDTDFLQTIPQLRHFVWDMDQQKDQQPPRSDFANWSLYPQHSACGISRLTGRGALQHLFNGLSLREKYVKKWDLFGSRFNPAAHLTVYSTLTSRTYQSAVALLYGFLPHFNLSQVHIQTAQNVMFCKPSQVPPACCANLGKLRREADQAVRTPRGKGSLWMSTMAPLAHVFGVKPGKLPGPTNLIDIFQGHACHGLSLPCGEDGECVTPSMMKKLWELVDSIGRSNSEEALFDQYCRTVMHSLLLEMMRSMIRVSRGQSSNRFNLYSGHDLTMTPLLQVLGLYEGKWPRYATRVVVELYRKFRGKEDHFLRILHNGRDVTTHVRFCQGRTVDRMCPLKYFQYFVESENMQTIGVSDRQALQSFCRSKALF